MSFHTIGLRLALAGATTVALTAAAWAAQAFDVTVHGSFRRITHTGDASGQVRLTDLPRQAGTWGVGALAGFEGEVLLHDGQLLVSRGSAHHGATSAVQPQDQAALFVAARVSRWIDVPVARDLSQAEFEAFVVEQAQARGIDTDQPFPFLAEGRFSQLTWHVVTGQAERNGHAGGAHPSHARQKVLSQPGHAGRLVGIYSAARYEGIATHPGQRFHVHYVDESLRMSGHVDAYGLARGSTLRLPSP